MRARTILVATLVFAACVSVLTQLGMRPQVKWARAAFRRNGYTVSRKASCPRVFYRDAVVVLMYHNVSETYKGRGTISPAQFAAHVRVLRENGFNVISANQLAGFLAGRAGVPPNAVVLTFDDGYEGVYRHVFPVLRRYRLPATVFVVGALVGRDGFLTWPELRELVASGLFTVGGHTYDAHRRVPTGPATFAPASVARLYDLRTGRRETEGEYRARMLRDGLVSQETFRRELGQVSPFFAYPYGAYTPELDVVLKAAGFRYFFTTLHGANVRGTDRIYRVNAGKPSVPPEGLIYLVRRAAFTVYQPHRSPPVWLPSWASDPFLKKETPVSGQARRVQEKR